MQRKRFGSKVRPTMAKVREAIFSMIGPTGTYGLRVADLYAGTGSMGERALKKGASHVDFVEKDVRLCERIKGDLLNQGFADAAKVHKGDVLKVLPRLGGRYDIVFADPPYSENPFEAVSERLNLLNLLSESCVVFLEHSVNTFVCEVLPGLKFRIRKRYGDTAVTVYDAVGRREA